MGIDLTAQCLVITVIASHSSSLCFFQDRQATSPAVTGLHVRPL